MAYTRLRKAMWLLVVMITASVGYVSSSCTPVPTPGEGDNAVPDFTIFFARDFTLKLEMTEVANNHTNYVQHSYYVSNVEGALVEENAVWMEDEASVIVYHYFPEEERFIEQFDDSCVESPEEHPTYIPIGWFDEEEGHGAKMYGPAAILRSTKFQKVGYVGRDFDVDGITCERWYVCVNEEYEIDFYFSQRDEFDMPEKDMFNSEQIANRLPVMFEVIPENPSEHIRYTVVSLFPFLTPHSDIETPRGLACEDKISIAPYKKPPKIPSHFSLAEEVVANSMIDGILFQKEQYLDKLEVSYAEHLSMVRLDSTPPAEEKEEDQFPDKVIHDFNTGVQYAISRKYGKCDRGFIPRISFDVTHAGIGGSGVMAGPNEIFYLDESYSFVGERDARSLQGDLYTSTRSDIPDPETEFAITYPKAVLEYYFSQGKEVSPMTVNIPTRSDLFIYNKTDQQRLEMTSTVNFYAAKEIIFYDTDEFSVNECFDRYDDDWSTLYLFFPADKIQFAAEAANEYEFKHHIYFLLLEIGDISPTRIGSIDVSDGTSGWYSNTTDSDSIIVTVKLMDRAPYLYGYRIPDEPFQKPGDGEINFDVIDKEDCAELCSLFEEAACKSFHYCEKQYLCYLSETEGAQGPQTVNFTCEHYIDNHENQTFDDLPSDEVNIRLRHYIHDNKFTFDMKYQQIQVTFTATAHIMFKTPDPLDPILKQFSLYKRYHSIADPDATIPMDDDSLAACESVCIAWMEFKCETIVHSIVSKTCLLYADHVEDMNATRIEVKADGYIHARNYLNDYKFMLGGLSINTTGPIVNGYTPEECAWKCSRDDDFDCNSFEFCWSDGTCHLHVETFMDVSDGGNYTKHQPCMHFEKKAEDIFTRYPHEGMPNGDHKLVAQLTDVSACAKLCLEDMEQTCQSYDFCEVCESGDFDVCGSDHKGGLNMCFLAYHHIGEPGLKLAPSNHCEHYSRDLFGDQDYASWIATQRKTTKPYTGGSMAGLAFGMIFLGIILSVGIIFGLTKLKPGTLPKDISLGEVDKSLPRSGGKDSGVTFGNLTGGESDI